MNNQRPSLFRIIRTDYGAFIATITPLIAWFMYIFAYSDENTLLYISIGATALCIPLLLWRVFFFIRIFDLGEEAKAIIQSASFYRSRGRADYIYTYKGTRYKSGNLLVKSGRTNDLEPNKEVTVLVDPNNPKRAIIRYLFL